MRADGVWVMEGERGSLTFPSRGEGLGHRLFGLLGRPYPRRRPDRLGHGLDRLGQVWGLRHVLAGAGGVLAEPGRHFPDPHTRLSLNGSYGDLLAACGEGSVGPGNLVGGHCTLGNR